MKGVYKLLLAVIAILIIIFLILINSATDCIKLERDITKSLEEADYCEKDNECVVRLQNISVCPFGCYHVINKRYKLTKLRIDLGVYSRTCDPCVNDCDLPPEKSEIFCINSKCVVNRSENVNP